MPETGLWAEIDLFNNVLRLINWSFGGDDFVSFDSKQAFDHGRVLLAEHPLGTFRCHRESVLERRFSAFVALKRYITKPHALKEVGHIHRTDQFVDLMPVRAVAAAGSQREVVGERQLAC